MIDAQGFRANVGIVLCNDAGHLFWGRRLGMDAWQFPQGGIKRHESPEQAMLRELHEEVGLEPGDVEIIGATSRWLRYRLPSRYLRTKSMPLCIGQKQIWFALRLLSAEDAVNLTRARKPEFDDWRWVTYWRPLREVVSFKRRVYRAALTELAPLVGAVSAPPPDSPALPAAAGAVTDPACGERSPRSNPGRRRRR
ncbi:MAG: RNA pyrophosphohydrolase [Gammaproteobacteria bacterium]|nr:RNA pyrophosphohydrolase [Gammaproteobacteria bacterium]